MTIEEKIFDAVLICLSLGENITPTRLAKYSGLSRNALGYHVKKKKTNLNKKG